MPITETCVEEFEVQIPIGENWTEYGSYPDIERAKKEADGWSKIGNKVRVVRVRVTTESELLWEQ